MAGEIQEPLNLSLLENSIHSGSVSFGRFEKESLSWEKRSSFSRNVYLEEAEMFSKPGSVTQMRAHFEAHFKKKGIRFPTSVAAQTWREVEKDDSLWESTSQRSDELYKCDQEKSHFGDSCLTYDDDIPVNSLSATLEKTEIGCSETTLEDIEETKSSSATRSMKNVQKKANPYAAATKTSTKMHARTKNDSQRESKPKRTVKSVASKATTQKKTVKSVASKAPTQKKTDSLTPQVATNKFSLRTNQPAGMRREEKVESVARKPLNVKATPTPKNTKATLQSTSTGLGKARDEHSSLASCDRSMANGMTKTKLNSYKHKSLNGILPIKSSDQTTRNNVKTRRLAVRHSAVEVAM